MLTNISFQKEYKVDELSSDFTLKTLSIKYIDEIQKLLVNNYIEDDNKLTRIIYSRDFLYWYLSNLLPGFIVGLIYKKKLIGLITSMFTDVLINNHLHKIAYINLLCIHSSLTNSDLVEILISDMKNRITKIGVEHILFVDNKYLDLNEDEINKNLICSIKQFVIPINYDKLTKINFLNDDMDPIPEIELNPLHLIKKSDINLVVTKLNLFMEKIDIKPVFKSSAAYLLLPKKNIVYSFIKKDDDDQVTDFINVYCHHLYIIEQHQTILVAELGFYFYETMSLTDLVTCLLNKLAFYGVDQLVFRNFMENDKIDLVKFSTCDVMNYILWDTEKLKINPSRMSFYPI